MSCGVHACPFGHVYASTVTKAMMKLATDQAGLLLHLIVELPASINFLIRPSATLSVPQPQAHAVIRQYALLLFSTNLIVLVLLMREMDELSGKMAGALALYHVGPVARALSRTQKPESGGILGGPWLHAFVHVLCAVTLVMSFVSTNR